LHASAYCTHSYICSVMQPDCSELLYAGSLHMVLSHQPSRCRLKYR
jgi:hypothetical protein